MTEASPTILEPLVLTCEQVAELLQVPKDTIKNLYRVGQLRGVKVGKHLRYLRSHVVEYLATMTEGGDS